ncbi:CRISPR-associated endonuclease Cas3'', partial [Candidatus Gracilibacteria bacterium]|nr:CRISPR-associated endonuclease Cas3'' [Candidatus Gracilibacteria bacterium]
MIRRNITKTNLKSHPDKYLKDHLLEVGRESEKIINSKKLSLTLISKDILQKVSYLIGISHDFGKVTSYFQNKISKGMKSSLSHHGLISALFGYFIVNSYIDNKEISMISYIVIKKHHGNLESPLNCIELKNDLKAQIDDIEERLDDVIELYSLLLEDNFNINIYNLLKNIKEMIYNNCDDFTEDNFENIVLKDVDNEYGIERFLLTNFLYSVLIDCDKLSAANIKTRYFDGNLKSKISVENYLDKLKIENPEEFDENEEINRIRNEFFYEVINNVNIKKENFLYKLTAPTGI